MSRTRVVAYHPIYGPLVNQSAFRNIEHAFANVEAELGNPFLKPYEFLKWPRWKRAGWMATQLKEWKYSAFHEPRQTRISRSAFWLKAKEFGVPLKQKKKLPYGAAGLNRAAVRARRAA